jgi:hypothetical protein
VALKQEEKMSPQRISVFVLSMLFVSLVAFAFLSAPNVANAAPPTPAPRGDKQAAVEKLLRETGLEAGMVTANANGTLTLKTPKGTSQVQTNANTVVVVPDVKHAKVSDIHKGDRVVVQFPEQESTKPASFVMSFPADLKLDDLRLGAVMGAKRGGMLLRTRNGNQIVMMKPATVVVDISGAQPVVKSPQDLKRGNAVLIVGTAKNKTFNAQTVLVLAQDARELLQDAKRDAPAPTPKP